MPRPKIRPEDRIRAYRACDACKASKTRCDAKTPCANCIRRNRSSRCTYHATSRGRAGRQKSTLPPLLSPVPDMNVSGLPVAATGFPADGLSSASDGSLNTPSSLLHAERISAEHIPGDQESPQEHFVTGSNGENFYIAETTSLSFLDFLRHVLRRWVGATPFTEGARQSTLLEPDAVETAGEEISPDLAEKRVLFQSYCEVSSGILHLFSDAEVGSFLGASPENVSPRWAREDLAAMDAALAIGAQARASTPGNARYAATLFARARSVAFQDMLTNPNLAVVRLFLLLSFFTLGAGRQSAASIYLGIASKAAIVFGLHQPLSWRSLRQEGDYGARLRVWHSLCILEVLTNSVLGRPCTLPRATRHNVQSLPLDADTPAFNAILKGAIVLDDICGQLNRAMVNNIATAQDLLEKLRTWGQDLPPSLRRFSYRAGSSLTHSERKKIIGGLHLASIYYFAVILVTRPFLIESFMPRIHQRLGIGSLAPVDQRRASFAQVCMTSAIHMGHLCRQCASILTPSDLPLSNTGLVKSWAFGAGLVLGFSIFAGEPHEDLRSAFSGVVELLDTAAAISPQSRIYSRTLQELDETINLYKRLNSRRGHSMADQYVEQILVIDISQGTSGSPVQDQGDRLTLPVLEHPISRDAQDKMVDAVLDDQFFDHQGWEDLGFQFSDNFALDFGAGRL